MAHATPFKFGRRSTGHFNETGNFVMKTWSSVLVLAGSGLLTLCANPIYGQQLPQGGRLSAGQAQMSQVSSAELQITQQSQRAVIDWSSFNIGNGAVVNILQPSANAALLNRVNQGDPLSLMGKLQANGQVFITNPSGILIGPKAIVQAASLVASTTGVDVASFMQSSKPVDLFAQSQANQTTKLQGSIIQAGHLRVGSADASGEVALIAREVRQQGLIEAVGLQREGGKILLIGHSISLEPTSKLDVSSKQALGGSIRVEADRVQMQSARLDASGDRGGGVIHLGGAWQGAGSMLQATELSMDATSEIRANALGRGDGGEIVLWTDIREPNAKTSALGLIEAKGGQLAGDGGRIETSGAQLLLDGIRVNASARQGKNGQWLLDPSYGYSVIGSNEAAAISAALNTGTDVINLVSGTLNVSGNPVIHKTAGTDATLTLKASQRVNLFGTSILSSSGKLNLVLWANADGGNQYGISLNGSTKIGTNGGHVWMGGGAGSTNWLGLTVGDGYAAGSLSANYNGLDLAGDLNTLGGSVRILGQSSINLAGYADIMYGYGSAFRVNTGSGSIDLIGNRIAYSNASSLQTTGTWRMTSYGPAFTNSLTWNGSMSGSDFLGTESFRELTVKNITSISGVVFGRPGNTSNMNIKADLNAGGSVQIHGGQINLVAPINAPNQTVLLNGSKRIQAETSVAAITAEALILLGGGYVDLTMSPNRVRTLAVGNDSLPMAYVKFKNAQDLTLSSGSFDGFQANGVRSNGPVAISTNTGPLQIHAPVLSNDNSQDAIRLNAGESTNALLSSGGDIVFGPGASIETGTGGRATLYSGSVQASSSLANYIGLGTQRFRYGSDESTTNYSTALGVGRYVIYRERPEVSLQAASQQWIYGDSYAVSGTANGLVNGDSASFGFIAPQYSSSGHLKALAGGYLTEALNSAALQALGYQIQVNQRGLINVQPKALSLHIPSSSKVYDGNTSISLSGTASLSGVLTGDDVVLGSGSVTGYIDQHVGTNKAVTYTGFALSGVDQSNYQMPSQAVSTASITPKVLSVSGLLASDKVYDGTRSVNLFGGQLAGLVGNEALSWHVSGLFDQANAGQRQVAVSISLADGPNGDRASNYTLMSSSLNLPASIAPRLLRIVGAKAEDKIYDGNTSAQISQASLSGLVGAESLQFDAQGQFSSKDAGVRAVQASFSLRDGAHGGFATNYQLSNPTMSLNASITPKAIRLVDSSMLDKTYDGSITGEVRQGRLVGLIGHESLQVTSSGQFSSSNAGRQSARLEHIIADGSHGGLASNYHLVNAQETVIGSILPKPIQVIGTVVNDKTYDGNTDVRLRQGYLDGVLSGQTIGLRSDARFDQKDAGRQLVSVGHSLLDGPSGELASNYKLINPQEVFQAQIFRKELQVLNTQLVEKVYDGTHNATAFGGSLSGLVQGEELHWSAQAQLHGKDSGLQAVTVVHQLADTKSGTVSNYLLTNPVTEHSINVLPRGISIQGLEALDKVYDGTQAAQLRFNTVEGLVPGEYLMLGTKAAFVAKQRGNQQVSASLWLEDGISVGSKDMQSAGQLRTALIQAPSDKPALAQNYRLTQTNFQLTAKILPKSLSVSGLRVSDKIYDGNVNANLISLGNPSGVVPGDEVNLSNQSAQFVDSRVGVGKDVVVKGIALWGPDAQNYRIDDQYKSSASILTRELQLDIPVAIKVYDGQSSIQLPQALRFKNIIAGDQISLDTHAVRGLISAGAGDSKPVSYTGFSLSGADAANYRLASTQVGLANVLPATVSLSQTQVRDKIYDGTSEAQWVSSPQMSGVLPMDQVHLVTSLRFEDKTVGMLKPVRFNASLEGPDAHNYVLAPLANLAASVFAKALTVDVLAKPKWFDGSTEVTLTLMANAPEAGDLVSPLVSAQFVTAAPGVNRALRIESLELIGRDASNYRPVLGIVSGAAIVEHAGFLSQPTLLDSIAPEKGTAPKQAREVARLLNNASYSHPMQLEHLIPLRASLGDSLVFGQAPVKVSPRELAVLDDACARVNPRQTERAEGGHEPHKPSCEPGQPDVIRTSTKPHNDFSLWR